jgi:hypothetical protein
MSASLVDLRRDGIGRLSRVRRAPYAVLSIVVIATGKMPDSIQKPGKCWQMKKHDRNPYSKTMLPLAYKAPFHGTTWSPQISDSSV